MKAPENIYLFENPIDGTPDYRWLSKRSCSDDVEYIRKDAFMERTLKWYCLDCECNDNCNADHKCFFRQEYKRYLEGNDNAVPPKFDNAILPNEDAAKNYRYRHYIRKMQDAFIEKACQCYCDDICTKGMSGMCFYKHDGRGQVKNTFKYNECNELKLLINSMGKE